MPVTIKRAAELTGVPEHTLRAWERRYGAIQTDRSPGGYRLYDPAAIAAIQEVQTLVASGLPPRVASAEVKRRGRWSPPQRPLLAGDPVQVDSLISALARLDAAAVARIIDEQFALRDFEQLVDGWLMPALQRVGAAWARQEITVAGEHLLSNVVMRRLAAAYDAAGAASHDQPVIVGTPSGVRHDLGLLAFAVCLRRRGVATLYLGHDVPVTDWGEARIRTSALASVTAVFRRADSRHVTALASRLWRDEPSATLAVGGSQQRLAPEGCVPLGHSLADGAIELAQMVQRH